MGSVMPSLDAQRRALARDRYRPGYHYLAPSNWMNDPNGVIFWRGRYHLFYQYNPHGAYHGGRTGTIHWGHAVSDDLVHWEDLPIALTPTPGGVDRNGCYSGTAFANQEGVATIIYHSVPEGICIATCDDEMLVKWKKYPANPVIPTPTAGDTYKIDGAPCAWIEGDTYYAITGNSSRDAFEGREPDRAYLFRSKDLVAWEYLHPFYEGGHYTSWREDCAVPDFFGWGDKHVLLFTSHTRGPQYYVGTYADERFVPERHQRLAFGETDLGCRPGIFCEGQTLLDGAGRRVMIGRISEGRFGHVQRAAGWSGIMGVPTVLSLSEDDELLIDPAVELKCLRRDHQRVSDLSIAADSTVDVAAARGDQLDISAVFSAEGAEELGLAVLCSGDGVEQTQIRFNTNPNQLHGAGTSTLRELILDVTRSSVSDEVCNRESQRCQVQMDEEEMIELRVFVDRSVVEVFFGGVHYLAKRVYPARTDSLGVRVFARGGAARLRSLDVWRMDSVWPMG
ncbi:MAG: hypothetical protein CMJ49_01430 [Planctomycetaceae bacterium]|nr:hypothetical protein [Planctomycetaceae bacterium]